MHRPGNPLSRHLYQQELARLRPAVRPPRRRRIRVLLWGAWFVAVVVLGALFVLLCSPAWVWSRGRAQ